MDLIFLFILLFFSLYFYFKTRVVVPNGFVGFDGLRVYSPREFHTMYLVHLVDMSPRVTALSFAGEGEGARVRRFLITWRPDRSNLSAFLKQPKTDNELHQRIRTLPELDLAHHASLLGIEVVKVEQEKSVSRGPGVDLGDDVSIPY